MFCRVHTLILASASALTWLYIPVVSTGSQMTLSDGLEGDGHMTVRGDEFGAFGQFSVNSPGFGRFDPDSGAGLRDWQFAGALMLADDADYRWLMNDGDWPNDFVNKITDDDVIQDSGDTRSRASSFSVEDFGVRVELFQQTPTTGYNFVQRYAFHNDGRSPVEFKLVWFNDQDVELAQSFDDNRFGFVTGDLPRAFFIEDSDVSGPGDPGIDDRDRRISVITDPGEGVTFDGYFGAAGVDGGATRVQNYLRNNLGILDRDLNTIQEIDNGTGEPTGISQDEDGDGLMDIAVDVGAAMQFRVEIPENGTATLGLNYVGGSLANAVFLSNLEGDYNADGAVNTIDIDLLTGAINSTAPDLVTFDENGDGQVNGEDHLIWVRDHASTWIGDADLTGEFNSGDIIAAFAAGKYETGESASWSEGDWDGDSFFTTGDIIAAFADGGYEMGPRTAVVPEPSAITWAAIALVGFGRRRGGIA